MSIVSVYVGGIRHVINASETILSRANQAVATLERYKSRLDEVTRQLSVVEIEDFVTLRDALTWCSDSRWCAGSRSRSSRTSSNWGPTAGSWHCSWRNSSATTTPSGS